MCRSWFLDVTLPAARVLSLLGGHDERRAYPVGQTRYSHHIAGKVRRKNGGCPGFATYFRACTGGHAEVSSPIEDTPNETRVAVCFVLQPGRRRWRGATTRRRRIHGRGFPQRRRYEPRWERGQHVSWRRDRRQRFSRWRRLSRRLRRLLRRLRRLSRRLLRRLRRLLFTLFLLRVRARLLALVCRLRLRLRLLSGQQLSRLSAFTECDRGVCSAGGGAHHRLRGARRSRNSPERLVRAGDPAAQIRSGFRFIYIPDCVPRSFDFCRRGLLGGGDRKSTRLNSSHL